MYLHIPRINAHVRCIELDDLKSQELGFQHVDHIPLHYALKFTGCGQQCFHMNNVPEALLMLAINREGNVCGKEIRSTKSVPSRVSGYDRAVDILELHPAYDRFFPLGAKILLEVEPQLLITPKNAKHLVLR